MAKFKKIASSIPKPVQDVSSTDSEADVKPEVSHRSSTGRSIEVEANILDFLDERFAEKLEVRGELIPDATPIDLDEEDVFLLQVPKGYDVKALLGKRINLEKKTKLGEDAETKKSWEILNKKGQSLRRQVVAQVTADGRPTLTTVQPKGVLILREAIKETSEGDENLEEFLNRFDEEENEKIVVPSNLKVRHPLLGADYKKELASRAEVLSKVVKRIKEERAASPKKSKKRKATVSISEAATVELVEPKQESNASPEKKKRKKGLETTADLQWLETL